MTSLYRRHRPQTLDEVVGQTAIVRTMRNAIERGKVHHAYLFVGSRGTGKTSIAKILAKSLNCEQGPTLQPCGKCESCVTIAATTSMDVIEMDAASNNSVDDIRDLRERVGYAPAMGRWKVYILDEAHMLSSAAWNAFLKTLEEPPPNTIFVLATTEAHKVPNTIVDRCHRFDFQRPSLEEITTVLRRVAAQEGIEADDRSLAMIARSAAGSFRDALGTLDQLVTYGGNRLTFEDVLEALDVADAELVFGVTDALAARDPGAVFALVSELADSGRDPVQFMRDLTAHLRQLVVIQIVGSAPATFSVTADQIERMEAQAGTISQSEAIAAIDLLAAAVAAVKEGSDPRIQLEVALLKAARPRVDASTEALLRRVERLESAAAGEGPPAPAPRAPVEPARPEPPVPAPVPIGAADPEAPPRQEAQPPQEAPAEPAGAAAPDAPGDPPAPAESAAPPEPQGPNAPEPPPIETLWPAVLEQVRAGEGGQMLGALLSDARPARIEAGALVLVYPPAASFSKRKIEHPSNLDRLRAAIGLVAGRSLAVRFEFAHAPVQEEPGAPAPPVDEEELIARIKSEFDADEVVSAGAAPTGDEHAADVGEDPTRVQ